MLDFQSNQSLFNRFLIFFSLAPLVTQYVVIAEETGNPGPEKRQQVVDVITATVDEFHRQGLVPAEFKENIVKTAGEITDVVVAIHNTNDVFHHGPVMLPIDDLDSPNEGRSLDDPPSPSRVSKRESRRLR